MAVQAMMSGGLSDIIKTQLDLAVANGDKALAEAMNKKKFDDCYQAIFNAFYKIASDARNGGNAVGMNGSDSLIGSAAVHWYTEDKPTQESIVDILKGGTEVAKVDKPKTETKLTPKAAPVKPTTPKAAPMKVATSKATIPSKPKATIPTANPTPTAPTSTPAFRVIADDEDFDVD